MLDKLKSDEKLVDVVRGILSGTALDEKEPDKEKPSGRGRGIFKGDGVDGRTKNFKATVARINSRANIGRDEKK